MSRPSGIEVPGFVDADQERRWWAARRTALDHVLRLCVEGSSGGALVLRGSMALTAWLGDAAREPGDLDWVMAPTWVWPIDPCICHPHVDRAAVQQWPEAYDGAGAGELWRDDEFDTRGIRAYPPPEGLSWLASELDPYADDDHGLGDPRPDLPELPDLELIEALQLHPDAGAGVELAAADAEREYVGNYDHYAVTGVRLVLPWRADGVPDGVIHVDYAIEERLAEPARWTAIPRGDGGPPVAAATVSRALSLAWKLLWLRTDAAAVAAGVDGAAGAFGKDLYDAVLLAESPDTRLDPSLLGRVLGAEPLPAGEIVRWRVDWDRFRADHPSVLGDGEAWLARLARALEPVLGRGTPRGVEPGQMS
ncbi:hypothetical protein [Embleya sp. NBC_00896]|uniref:hypothetical protein n=1 Tax=Embleya sp. NBC_00896 TaxID=2975961 RepID=UPI003867609A|nr:hypothetical protein OG928_02870 [Embleya sp. NBC_00896]